ncbi:hypothetical protein [Filomicrobium sp.]|uniref:hypothetical protein n=1 Tax=Filomicrobium sp. TaxID=2024831 RepID=UPI0025836829|nr:hypothetical protein [Filomicrobium sp.]MCV0369526.1 hypothetical protein [Filomicrobium sp.]
MGKNLFSVTEFCNRNGLNKSQFYREIARGRLIARKVGVQPYVSAEDERSWLDALPRAQIREAAAA